MKLFGLSATLTASLLATVMVFPGSSRLVERNLEGCCPADEVFVPSKVDDLSEVCFDLLAGKKGLEVGEVCVSTDYDDISVEYSTFEAEAGEACHWELDSVKSWLGLEQDGYPRTKKGNPKLGHFPYKDDSLPNHMAHEVVIPLCDIEGDSGFVSGTAQCCLSDIDETEDLYLMAKADVTQICNGKKKKSQGAWADGDRVVKRGNWATQASFSISCIEDTPCFPKDAVVALQGKGLVHMKDLQLGDKIRSGNDFSGIYAFATRVNDKVAFVKLTTAAEHTIELSGNHMIFVGKHMTPKLASNAQVGDELMLMPDKVLSKIVSIEKVTKEGAIHPLTYDGTLVVNGILASAHAADLVAPVVKLGTRYIINMHQFQQMLFAPLRLACKISSKTFCSETNHWRGDSHHYVDMLEYLEILLMPQTQQVDDMDDKEEYNFLQSSALVTLRTVFLLWVATVYLLEQIFTLRFALAAASAILAFRFWSTYTVKKLRICKKID